MRTALVGSKTLGVEVLRLLRARSDLVAAVTFDDRGDSRSRFEEFMDLGARIGDTSDLPGVDLVVVACWYRRIPTPARMLGIHHSLLPRYRGGSPLVWAMLNGEPEVGTSLFELTEEMDAGAIWGQQAVAVPDGAYVGEILPRLDAAALGLLARVLDGSAEPRPQDHALATWVRSRKPSDGLIDLARPAVELQRWVRAQSRPYPGAFLADGTIVWRARAEGGRFVIEESARA